VDIAFNTTTQRENVRTSKRKSTGTFTAAQDNTSTCKTNIVYKKTLHTHVVNLKAFPAYTLNNKDIKKKRLEY